MDTHLNLVTWLVCTFWTLKTKIVIPGSLLLNSTPQKEVENIFAPIVRFEFSSRDKSIFLNSVTNCHIFRNPSPFWAWRHVSMAPIRSSNWPNQIKKTTFFTGSTVSVGSANSTDSRDPIKFNFVFCFVFVFCFLGRSKTFLKAS